MTRGPWRVATHRRERLAEGWQICATAPGALHEPSQLAAVGPWIPAAEASSVAAVLREAKQWSLDDVPRRFDAQDWWYRLTFDTPALDDDAHEWVLGFDGLATVADVWLDGALVLHSDNMFVAHELPLRPGRHELALHFHALDAQLAAKRPRPRWRAPMIEQQQLRWHRTTLLGRTPGWSPPSAVVGPWRDVWVEQRSLVDVDELQLQAQVDGHRGIVELRCMLRALGHEYIDGAAIEISRGGAAHRQRLSQRGEGRFAARLAIEQPDLWWPHTHGEPALYGARLLVDVAGRPEPVVVDLGRIGFRTLALDTAGGRFALRVNGEPVFCRGACWTPIDPVALRASPAQLHEAVALVRDAGMNMLRVPGTMVYEEAAFHDACDELGVLVWQDFMFANMDYPADDERFAANVHEEVRQAVQRWRSSASLAVLCGNSEVEQQAAMWGAPREQWQPPLFHQTLPQWLRDAGLGHLPYWPSSAHGGAFPFQADAGTTSYYGVGAYLRPLEDARRAELRFATECLAFANIPDDATLARMPGGGAIRVHQPAWKQRSPRDLGAGWDFDDVRDHYLALLHGVDPVRLRYADHERYLALGRVVTGEVMAASFAEWRRAGSVCGGALLWFLRDLWAGAGWGVLDDAGRPKPCWHVLRRALQPTALAFTDEGGNGLHLHLHHEPARAFAGLLRIEAYNADDGLVAQAGRPVELAARSSQRIVVAECFDGFHDFSYAYRFGPPSARVVMARLHDDDGSVRAEAFHFPAGLACEQRADVGLRADVVEADERGVTLHVRAERFAQSVCVELAGHVADDNHFHLAPGGVTQVRLRRHAGSTAARRGSVRALNARGSASFEVDQ